MFKKRKKEASRPVDPPKPKTDGRNTFISFDTTTHAEAGCPNNCDGDHVRVAVHGCRPNLDDIPFEEWTTPEILATNAAEFIAEKLTITKTEPKGFLQ
jgi:hypothetical protein